MDGGRADISGFWREWKEAGILLLNPPPGNLLQITPSQSSPADAISCPYRKLPVKKPKFSERKSLCSPISREECGEIVGICLVFVRKMIGYLLKISYNSVKSGEFLLENLQKVEEKRKNQVDI